MKTLPNLNVSMILDLIKWAELSETRLSDLAERFPHWGRWDQSNWGSLSNETRSLLNVDTLPRVPTEAEGGVCSTSYCMAGQAAIQSDYRLDYGTRVVDGRDTVYADRAMPQRPSGKFGRYGHPIYEDVPGAEMVSIETAGRIALGLTDGEAEVFFEGDNGLEDLKAMANRFAYQRGLPFLFPDEYTWGYSDDEAADRFGYDMVGRLDPDADAIIMSPGAFITA